ncbi:MAG: FkbM family methyltransferase [Stenotrophobium sp.]
MNLKKAIHLLRQPAHWKPLLKGVAASVEHDHLSEICPGINTVIDIGANKGQFSLEARKCFPHANIIAFEPLPDAAKKFRSVFPQDSQVTLHQVAIGAARQTAVMHLSGRDDSSSLLSIGSRQSDIFPGTEEVGTLQVQVAPLDELVSAGSLRRPALLKLDVQGYELSALKGCERMLPQFEHIYLELSFVELYQKQPLANEVLMYLQQQGFELQGIYNLNYDVHDRAIQGDFHLRQRQMKAA